MRGFTLMELLLVISIVAITAAVGFPTVYHDMNADADRQAIWAIATDIEYARSMGLSDLSKWAGCDFTPIAGKPGAYRFAGQIRRLDGYEFIATPASFTFNGRGQPKVAVPVVTVDMKRMTSDSTSISKGMVRISAAGVVSWP